LKEIDDLPLPEYFLYVMCMYNYIALNNGVDPENPPEDKQEETGTRKVSGAEAVALFNEFKATKEKAAQEEG